MIYGISCGNPGGLKMCVVGWRGIRLMMRTGRRARRAPPLRDGLNDRRLPIVRTVGHVFNVTKKYPELRY